ncbi:MAG: hypothetical protein MUF02_00845 [Acidobacteria bacterium]|jgi:hypothetical protein|nr:hypothetical protein [Acidobacteriota bacterium]
MRLRFSLYTIPVSLAALGLWAVIGGWYVTLVPANLSGPDNIGIVLSTFGACLFLADRLAYYWLKIDSWLILFKLWLWGLLFVFWGLVEWLGALSGANWLIFTAHWLAIAAIVLAAARFAWLRRRVPG